MIPLRKCSYRYDITVDNRVYFDTNNGHVLQRVFVPRCHCCRATPPQVGIPPIREMVWEGFVKPPQWIMNTFNVQRYFIFQIIYFIIQALNDNTCFSTIL